MEDEESIAHLMGLGGDGVAVTYEESGNPFRVSENPGRTAQTPSENCRVALESQRLRKLSLLQRIDNDRPNIPPCVTRATRLCRTSQAASRIERTSQVTTASSLARTRAEPLKQQRKQIITEFVLEKREKYLVQLIINRKAREINRLRNERALTERRVKEREKEIEDEAAYMKMMTVRIEASLARARRVAEAAAQNRATKARALHQVQMNLEEMKSQITRNEILLEDYRPYLEFLQTMLPKGKTIEYFFKSPYVLLDELHHLENENLFIVQSCRQLEDVLERAENVTDAEIAKIRENEEEVMRRIEMIAPQPPGDWELSPEQKKQVIENEEFKELAALVKKTYIGCFGSDADLDPLSLLERLELQLERMYKLCTYISPEFLSEKQYVQDRAYREKMRKQRQERVEREQKRKIDQAIARARKPIPKKAGRPLYQRTLPISFARHGDEELLKRRQLELLNEQRFLFGNSDDEYR